MVFHEAKEAAERFVHYVGELVGVIGHADRAGPLRDYCTGLLLPGERKSVEPMAALTAPARTAAQHQSLLHFVGQAPWSDAAVLTKVRELVLPHWKVTARSRLGSSTIRAFPRRGAIASVRITNIAASWASRRIVKWRCRCPAILIIELKWVRNHCESGPGRCGWGVRQIESGSI
jgi:hypothetical protein